MSGEVADALSRWTFGQPTPRDGDGAARAAHRASLEHNFDEWVVRISRERLGALERLLGPDQHYGSR